MDDRERIARAIHDNDSYYRLPFDLQSDIDRAIIYRQADAVLAALGDRLLPELPDDAGWIGLDIYRRNSTDKILRGVGPTIPAAIRAALKDAQP